MAQNTAGFSAYYTIEAWLFTFCRTFSVLRSLKAILSVSFFIIIILIIISLLILLLLFVAKILY